MRNPAETGMVYMNVKAEAIRLAEKHEAESHGGLPCDLERHNLIAFLCHGLGVRGDYAFFEIENLLAHYDALCPSRQCPDARKRTDPPKCSTAGCGRDARYTLDRNPPLFVCIVHAPDASPRFNDWDARGRFMAWEAGRAGRPVNLASPVAIRQAAEEISRRWQELDRVALENEDGGSGPDARVAAAVSEILCRVLLGGESGALGEKGAGRG